MSSDTAEAAVSGEVQTLWAGLAMQVSDFNAIITIEGQVFDSLDEASKLWIENQYMTMMGIGEPVFVRDTAAYRVFLGFRSQFPEQNLLRFPGQVPFWAPDVTTLSAKSPASSVAANTTEMITVVPKKVIGPKTHKLLPATSRKRPLNAFIAFRSYYSAAFHAPQKAISREMHALWQREPCKARWAVVAKAYTLVREHMRLREFLAVVCPHVGIIHWDKYVGYKGIIEKSVVNEQDIIAFLTSSGFLQSDFQGNSRITESPYHVMATDPQNIRQNFIDNISMDPRGVAAQILGLEENSLFIELSAGETGVNSANSSAHTLSPYKWSGDMSHLYDINEGELDMTGITGMEWNTTNISEPTVFDGTLELLGYNQESLALDPRNDPIFIYNPSDGF